MTQTLTQIKAILSQAGLSPKKSLGQNFLIDHNLIRKLCDSCQPPIAPGDVVLEIGPGTGALTGELLDRGCVVVACELDDALATILPTTFAHAADRLTIVRGDCLDGKRAINPAALAAIEQRLTQHSKTTYRLIANLPYGAATPVITTLLLTQPRCASLHVTIQREVVDRLSASPGTRDWGVLSVIAQALARVRPVAILPPGCFWPPPDVTSAMVALDRFGEPLVRDVQGLADFAQRVLAQRRKQLGSVLRAMRKELGTPTPNPAPASASSRDPDQEETAGVREILLPPGVTPEERAENLTLAQLAALRDGFEALHPRQPGGLHLADKPPRR